ncbi:MAG: IS3 family transposase [Christensenellaceae bacterium]|nr:IS3 family transposase [Christensenellaceae bacterium]
MSDKYTETQKQEIVALYTTGTSVAELCAQYGVPRSTLYFWIHRFSSLKTITEKTVYYQEYLDLKRHADKLERQLEVIKAAGCGMDAPLQEKLAALERLYGQYSVHTLCDALEVSRGTFYNHIFRRTKISVYDRRREEIREQVQIVFEECKQRYGAKKICAVLADRGIRTSSKYVAELMREMDLQCVGRNAKREYQKQVNRRGRPNVLKQQFDVSEPNCVWVSDITYFKVKDKFYYICTIIDLFSRKVIAHGISPKNSTYLVTSTFKKAFESRMPPQGIMFHSDQGVQYTSHSFQKLLRMNKVVQSFSKTGRPNDNAVAEAFFSSMKKEELYRTNYKSEREFRTAVDDYIYFYNVERPHAGLAYRTPDRIETQYQAKQEPAG